jgi:hypothetical protein
MLQDKLLGAHLAVARRRPDARGLLEEIDSLLIDVGNVNIPLVIAPGQILSAQLWEALGDDRKALEAIRRQDGEATFSTYASSRLRLRARVAERLGLKEEAIRALRLFVGMRERAEPRLQSEVREARERLAALESDSRGR